MNPQGYIYISVGILLVSLFIEYCLYTKRLEAIEFYKSKCLGYLEQLKKTENATIEVLKDKINSEEDASYFIKKYEGTMIGDYLAEAYLEYQIGKELDQE